MVYVDNRDWSKYNETLVLRGDFYLDFGFLESWNEELSLMNEGKRGRPFLYPEGFVLFSGAFYEFFHLPFRQLEGVLRKLSKYVPGLKAADYTTLWHRINSLVLTVPCYSREPLVVAVDSTGLKVTNRGDWLRKKHGYNGKDSKRRGWLKVHIAVDTATKKLLSIEITDERTTDHEMLEPLVQDLALKELLGDGGYDTREAFKFLKEHKGLDPLGIRIRDNASRNGLSDRSFAVREYQTLGYDEWKNKHCYGLRWAVEGVFSAVKRGFGETMRATSIQGMKKEATRKFILYNMLLDP
jgi:hypothetical protein